ncbi:MAG: IPT/TIG domain-containing protein [Bacteroidales bacterium]
MEASSIGQYGVKLEAKVLTTGTDKILDYGFICNDKKYNNEFTYSLLKKKDVTDFNIIIESDFRKNYTYSCYSYIKTENYFVKGNTVAFTSQGSETPQIKNISPLEGYDGSSIIMTCKYMNHIATENNIYVNNAHASIKRISNDSIIFWIPDNTKVGKAQIAISNGDKVSELNETFNIIGPTIESITKTSAHSGEILTIEGNNLLKNGSYKSLFIGSLPTTIISANDNSINFIVPYNLNNLFSDYEDTLHYQNGLKTIKFSHPLKCIKSWSQLKSPPFDWSYYYQSFVYSGKGYIYEVSSKNFVEYNPQTNDWHEITTSTFPGERSDWCKFVVIDNKIYKFGGIDYLHNKMNELWEFDFINQSWKRKNNTPFSSGICNYSWIDDELFVISDVGELWKCDFENEKYTKSSNFPKKVERGFLFAFNINNELYIASDGHTYKYDITNNTWTQKNSYPYSSYSDVGFTLNNSAYILHSGMKLYKYNSLIDLWVEVSNYPVIRGSDSNKTVFVIGNKAYFNVTSSSTSGYSPALFEYQER